MKIANNWTRDTLAKIGMENSHLEDWGVFRMGWYQINTWGRIVTPDPEPIWMQAAVIMAGGHLDSWISGTGATDNGAGGVVAMEAFAFLRRLNVKPKRTIRIALWSGEEQANAAPHGQN